MEISISEIHEILTQAAANEESLIAALEEIQARCRVQVAALHGGVKRLQHPHAYPAGLERGLAERKAALIYEYRQKIKS